MAKFVALLRAVNVGKSGKLPMAKLRAFAGDLGLLEPKTLLNSGNVVFATTRATTGGALEKKLAKEGVAQLHLARPEFFVRTHRELRAVLAHNPFPKEAKSDPSHLVVFFVERRIPAKALRELKAAISGPERIAAQGRELYAVYPAGIGRSKLTIAVLERKLGMSGTGRNWNTVQKLADATT